MSYNPLNQYRCTIIRGKSQTEMEDFLPFYAQMIHSFCPCTKIEFQQRCFAKMGQQLFNSCDFENLPKANQKTIKNHITEIAGKLLGLYYIDKDNYVYETESCQFLLEKNDYPAFFKNLCANLQFPNGSQKIQNVLERVKRKIRIKPLCYVVSLLEYARTQEVNKLLTKQEIGFYVLNNLDVLQGSVSIIEVYNQIMHDRTNRITREKLSGSRDWQHINEQFNLLDLSNITSSDDTYIWINSSESNAVKLFISKNKEPLFDMYAYDYDNDESKKQMFSDWGCYYGKMDDRFKKLETNFKQDSATTVKERGAVGLTTVELGDQGEALVYKLECERVRAYKERLVNKVLLLGKTKGLGYDISSIEADENPQKPEFARYIEVKSTKRSTEPSFDNPAWNDTLNLTSKEWIAAEQYKEYYNIYRVYFTKTKIIIVRIQNPFKLAEENKVDVFPTIYQMNFSSSVIKKQYEKSI